MTGLDNATNWPFVSGRAQTVGGTGKSLQGGLRKKSVPLAPSLCSWELAVAFYPT